MERLFARVRDEAGRLDVLVNDVWGGDALTEWGKPFWELSIAQGFRLLERAVHSHIITSRHGAPLMVARNAGLIVEVTDGDTFGYRGNLVYDVAKNAVVRLAYAMAADLRPHHVTALAVTPGFLRSEHVLDSFGVTEASWRDAIEKDPYFAESETPCLVGRVVAALAADPDVARKSGRLFAAWTLSKEYGIDDVDGRRPDWGTFFPRKVREIVDGGEPTGDEPLHRPQPPLPGRARPDRGGGSRAPALVARPPRMRSEQRDDGRHESPQVPQVFLHRLVHPAGDRRSSRRRRRRLRNFAMRWSRSARSGATKPASPSTAKQSA